MTARAARGYALPALALFAGLLASACGDHDRFIPPEVAPGNYRRIVSLTPSITEILFAMDAGDRLKGATTWCDFPEEAKSIPRVGDFLKPNFEALLALEPDLIVMAATGTELKQSYDNCASLGLNVLVVWNNTLKETLDAVRILGRTLCMEKEAKLLEERIREGIARESARWKHEPRKSVLWVVGHRPLIAVGEGTYQAEILKIAGGVNVISAQAGAWPSINEEFVIQADPEVIIDSSMGGEEASSRDAPAGQWSRFPSVRAVRNGCVHLLYHDSLYRPGPRMEQALKIIGEAVHAGEEKH